MNENNYIKKGFVLDVEWNIFYDNGGRNDLIIDSLDG